MINEAVSSGSATTKVVRQNEVAMEQENHNKKSAPAMRPCTFAIASMTVPARRWATRTDLMVQISRAERFMRDAPISEVSIQSAAAVAGISRHHFIRLFHEIYSVSPGAYIAKLQCQRAKTLLQENEASILEVAIEAGFNSASAFSRFFKAKTGYTPTEYRRQNLNSGFSTFSTELAQSV